VLTLQSSLLPVAQGSRVKCRNFEYYKHFLYHFFHILIKKENLRTACKDKEILNMLSIGVSLDEIFYSENGELIFEYTIEDRDCKILQ